MNLVKDWLKKIDEQVLAYDNYFTRGSRIVSKYREESFRSDYGINSCYGSYNLLFSNTELLRPVLYNQTPRAEVRSASKKNDLARKAADILEKTINNSCKNYDFDYQIISSINDYLLPGQGLSRICYDPIFQEVEEGGEKREIKVYEQIKNEYVNWTDVIIGPASKWEDVDWIAFRSVMTKHEIDNKFGPEVASELTYNDPSRIKNNIGSSEQQFLEKNLCVTEIFEVWDKENREVIFISRQNTERPLMKNDDPLTLRDFFPIPRPLFSVSTNNTLIPVPFFVYYQDLQYEIEEISSRITNLVRELKRRGIYDSRVDNLSSIVNGQDNEFLAVENYDRIAQNGGVNTLIDEIDITRIAQVLQGLYQQREQIRFSIFEIMGIADIQRAVVDPRETATASRMKGHYGSLRVSQMQREVQRYIRDIYRIKGEIISEHFSPEVISLISDTPLEEVISVMPLLREQEPRMVLIDIETDSTIAADEENEKGKAAEFISAITQLGQALPQLSEIYGLDFAGEVTISAIRKFKMSRGLEDVLEQRVQELKQQQQQSELQAQQQGPTAEQLRAQNEQVKLQLDAQKLQAESQRAQIEIEQQRQKLQLEAQLRIAELQLRQQELSLKAAETQSKVNLSETKQALDTATILLEQQKLEVEKRKVEIEGQNPNVNTVVGV